MTRLSEQIELDNAVSCIRELNKNLAILLKLNKKKNNEESFDSSYVNALNYSILKVDDCRHLEKK
jgi:hypothetical protein